MKIVVVYGDDELKAKSRFLDIIKGVHKKGWEVKSITPSSSMKLSESLSAGSLFGEEVLYTCESAETLSEKELVWLSQNCETTQGSLLLYFKARVPAKLKKILPKSTKYEEFKLPKLIFSWLESLYPGNTQNTLKVLHKLTENEPLELAFALLARHMRDLYWVLCDPQITNIPAWRKSKLLLQANKLGKEKIAKIINKMADADRKAKRSEVPLLLSVDRLIIEEL